MKAQLLLLKEITLISEIQKTLDNIKKVSVKNGYPFLIGTVDQVRNSKEKK